MTSLYSLKSQLSMAYSDYYSAIELAKRNPEYEYLVDHYMRQVRSLEDEIMMEEMELERQERNR